MIKGITTNKLYKDLEPALYNRQEAINQILDNFIDIKERDKQYGLDYLIELNDIINNNNNTYNIEEIELANKKRRMILLVIKDEIAILSRALYIKYNLKDLYSFDHFYYEVDLFTRGLLLEKGINLE